MPVKGFDSAQDRSLRRELQDKDIAQREKESKRKLVGDIFKGASKMLPTMKLQHPEWYKKWMGEWIDKFVSLPTYVDVTVGSKQVTGGYGDANTILSGYDNVNHVVVNQTRFGAYSKIDNDQYNGLVHVVVHEYLPHLGFNDPAQFEKGTGGLPGSWRDRYPINATTLQVYGNMGKVNSRSIDADISIYGMYIVAAVDLYAFASELKSMLDLYLNYQMNNSSMPRAILFAKGWDPDAFLAHIADWRKTYIQIRELLNTTIPVPAELTLLARRVWMASTIIKDADNIKAPYMLFKQVSYGLLSESSTEIEYKSFLDYPTGGTGGGKPVRLCEPGDCLEWFKYASRRITQSDDFTTLIANLRASVGSFYQLPTLDVKGPVVVPINDDIRLQMQNIVTLPSSYGQRFAPQKNNTFTSGIFAYLDDWRVFNNGDGSMQQETNFKVQEFTSTTTNPNMNALFQYQFGMYAITEMSKKLNSFNPWDSDRMLVATRLHPIFRGYCTVASVSGTDYLQCRLVIAACGTEIITGTNVVGSYPNPQNNYVREEGYIARLYTDILNSNASTSGGGQFTITIGYPENIYTLLPQINGLYTIVSPSVNTSISYNANTNTYSGKVRFGVISQLDDFFYIEDIDLANIHDVCVKSEYYLAESDFGKGFIKR